MSGTADIVVVGGSESERDAVVALCRSAGIEVRAAASITVDAPVTAPALVMIVGDEAAALVGSAREVPGLAGVPILAIVPPLPATAATEVLTAGATDVMTTPLHPAIAAARIRSLTRGRPGARWTAGTLAPMVVRVADALGLYGDGPDGLDVALAVLREGLGFERASLVAHIEGSANAFVLAATDDPTHTQFALAIDAYPEITECIRTGAPVLIDDALSSPLLAPVAAKLAPRQVRGVVVMPVSWRARPLAVVLLRKSTPGVSHLEGSGLELARVVAGVLAGHLRAGTVMESLRERTHKLSRARYEAERRLRGIESMRDYFDASYDGVVILDEKSRILFVNRAAERITGFARDGLIGSDLGDLVDDEHRGVIRDVVAQVLGGGNHEPFDLQLSTTSGSPATVAVTTSTVLAATGAVTLTFRDVTAQRELELELRSTKEFLERLIDSTVDAIVAADMSGQLILFNQGAERIYGWRAEEVIGKLNVASLYPDGVAHQIMRMLRSTSYGGVGRLEQTRREIRTNLNELVPVNMTASIVYEGDREVATVGIFSDLRDRIRIEQKLLQAQQKLQITEKQALVAELAGAAAHELNQPLTSIIGYAQLVQRQSAPGAQHLRGVSVILREAERMADIVRKIGRITKYETTQYVGSASIIDLERSTQLETPSHTDPIESTDSSTSGGDWEKTREFDPARVSPEVAAVLQLDDDPALDPDEHNGRPARKRTAGELDEIRPSDRDLGLGPRRGGS